jgi:hypothetical protein
LETGEQSKVRAARAVAWLWGLTCITFLLHRQGAIPLFSFFGAEEKWPSVLVNLLACVGVLAFPLSLSALGAAFVASLLANLAWHSWLGAYQPLVPLAFLWLLFFRRESPEATRRALVDSLLLALAAGILHRANSVYLTGFEFLPGGTLFRDLPEPAWFSAHARAWAWFWLLSGALPLPLLLRGRRAGFLIAGLAAIFSVVLYKVLFFGFFLLVPALFFWDSTFLLEWRSKRFPRQLAPVHFYVAGMISFFCWYLLFRDLAAVFILSTALCSLAVLCARSFRPVTAQDLARSFRRKSWAALLLAYLLLPFVAASIPPPFGMTQFSAREARFPPEASIPGWRGIQDCAKLKREYALRWGYAAWPSGETCRLLRYRD